MDLIVSSILTVWKLWAGGLVQLQSAQIKNETRIWWNMLCKGFWSHSQRGCTPCRMAHDFYPSIHWRDENK